MADCLILKAQVFRHGVPTPEHPYGAQTPIGDCQLVMIAYDDGGTSIHVGSGAWDAQPYQTEIVNPEGKAFVAAILAGAEASAKMKEAITQ